MSDLAARLREWDLYAPVALASLAEVIEHERDAVLAIARDRFIEGHYRTGDTEMFFYTPERLRREARENLADFVNYEAVRIQTLNE